MVVSGTESSYICPITPQIPHNRNHLLVKLNQFQVGFCNYLARIQAQLGRENFKLLLNTNI